MTLQGREETPLNRIFSVLASENGILLRQFSLGLILDVSAAEDTFSRQGRAQVRMAGVSGPSAIKGYDLGSFLIPSSLKYRIIDKERSLVMAAGEADITGSTTNIEWAFPDSIRPYRIEFHTPSYSWQQWEAFSAAILEVKDYLALCKALDHLLSVSERIRFEADGEEYPSWIAFVGILVSLNTADSLADHLNLPLHLQDPGNWNIKRKSLEVQMYRHSLSLDRRLLKEWPALPETGELAARWLEFRKEWYMHPDFQNPFYNPVFSILCKAGFGEVLLSELTPLVLSVIEKTQGQSRSTDFQLAAASFCRQALEVSDEWHDKGMFTQSMLMLKDAVQTAATAGLADLEDRLRARLSRPALGIYNSYLTVATDAIKFGNLAMGETYLAKALEYLTLNREWLMGAPGSAYVYENFADVCLQKAHELYGNGLYADAMPYIRKALDYASRIPAYSRIPELDRLHLETRRQVYRQQVSASLKLLQNGQYAEGKQLLDEARLLRQTTGGRWIPEPAEDSAMALYDKAALYTGLTSLLQLSETTGPDSLQTLAEPWLNKAKRTGLAHETDICPLILENGKILFEKYLSVTGSLLWDFRIAEARNCLATADSIALRWFLRDCEAVNARLDEFRLRVIRQECLKARFQFDQYKYRMEAALSQRHYLNAKQWSDSALAVEVPGGCPVNFSEVMSLRDSFSVQITYALQQKFLLTGLVTMHGDSVFQFLGRLRNQWLKSPELRSDFEEPDTLWLLSKPASGFILSWCFQRFADHQQWESAFRLMDTLRQAGFSSDRVEEWQQILGKEWARKEFASLKPSESLALLDRIAPDTRWYAVFREAFRKEILGIWYFFRP